MKVSNKLIKGNEKKERILIFIGLTGIRSKKMKEALIEYYCGVQNRTKRTVAALNNVEESNLNRDMKKVERVAGEFEKLKEIDWPEYQAFKEYQKALN
jgi:hypothetical protein